MKTASGQAILTLLFATCSLLFDMILTAKAKGDFYGMEL
jgi:hypothetical protein